MCGSTGPATPSCCFARISPPGVVQPCRNRNRFGRRIIVMAQPGAPGISGSGRTEELAARRRQATDAMMNATRKRAFSDERSATVARRRGSRAVSSTSAPTAGIGPVSGTPAILQSGGTREGAIVDVGIDRAVHLAGSETAVRRCRRRRRPCGSGSRVADPPVRIHGRRSAARHAAATGGDDPRDDEKPPILFSGPDVSLPCCSARGAAGRRRLRLRSFVDPDVRFT